VPHHPPERLTVDGEHVLRCATPDDALMLALAITEALDHLRPWMSWASAEAADVEEQRRRLATGQQEREAGTSYHYLLVDTADTLVGVLGLHRRVGPDAAELGYWMMPAYVGHGHLTRAATVLVDAALALPDVHRLEIHCDEANVRSAAVPRRLGFTLDRMVDDGIQAPAEVGRDMVWVYPPASTEPE
jgi:RimJ/RimL family protein N-acetyltransferase